jgi:hypothetical protein
MDRSEEESEEVALQIWHHDAIVGDGVGRKPRNEAAIQLSNPSLLQLNV